MLQAFIEAGAVIGPACALEEKAAMGICSYRGVGESGTRLLETEIAGFVIAG
jgi:hypothetical protein